jgi:hypothetical protein
MTQAQRMQRERARKIRRERARKIKRKALRLSFSFKDEDELYAVLRDCLGSRMWAETVERALRDHVAEKAQRAAEWAKREAEEAKRAAEAAELDQAEGALLH